MNSASISSCRWFLSIPLAILCMGSLVCSVVLFYSMPSDPLFKWLFAAFAVAFECCKFAFFPVGWWLFGLGGVRHRLMGLAFLLIAAVLLGASAFASVSFLEGGRLSGDEGRLQASQVYQALGRKLVGLEAQMATRNDLASGGIDYQIITGGGRQMDAVADLQGQWDVTFEQLQGLTVPTTEGVGAVFVALAERWSTSAEAVRRWAFVGLAIMVELCAVALIALLSGRFMALPDDETEAETRADVVPLSEFEVAKLLKNETLKKPLQAVATGVSGERLPFCETVTMAGETVMIEGKVLEIVVAVEFGAAEGVKPVVRQFTKQGYRHDVVKRAFDALEAKGVIERSGSGYALVVEREVVCD